MILSNISFAATCPVPSFINGEVQYSTDQVENGEYPTDTVAGFTCNDGYSRNGPISSTCKDSGTWSPVVPTCVEGIMLCSVCVIEKREASYQARTMFGVGFLLVHGSLVITAGCP